MSRKPRRKKDDPASASPSGDTPSAEAPSEETSTEETSNAAADDSPEATQSAESPAKPEPTRTSKLPSFGFAADLLAARSSDAAETDGTATDGDDAPYAASADTASSSGQAPDTADDTGAENSGAAKTGAENTGTENTGDLSGLTPDRIFHFADSLEREEEDEAVAQRLTTWITFSLEGETFALPVEPVREVLRLSHITRVPHAPRPIRGVTNLRGRVIPVIDLRVRIELPATSISRSTRVIVVDSRGRLIGLLVDSVHQVAHIDLNRVQPPPDDVMTQQSDYLAGVYQQDEKLILLLDVDRALIIREAEAAQLGQGAA